MQSTQNNLLREFGANANTPGLAQKFNAILQKHGRDKPLILPQEIRVSPAAMAAMLDAIDQFGETAMSVQWVAHVAVASGRELFQAIHENRAPDPGLIAGTGILMDAMDCALVIGSKPTVRPKSIDDIRGGFDGTLKRYVHMFVPRDDRTADLLSPGFTLAKPEIVIRAPIVSHAFDPRRHHQRQ